MAKSKVKAITAKTSITPASGSGLTFSRNTVVRTGNIVVIDLSASGTINGGAWKTIGTMPSGFYRTSLTAHTTIMLTPSVSGFFQVTSAGTVQVYPGANISSMEAVVAFPLE